jgi:hypothetical protein
MKARMKMSLNSASLATSARKPSPVSSRNSPGSVTRPRETAASGDHGHFSGELTRPVFCNQVFACDLHSSGKNYVERNVFIARFEEYVACGDLPRPAAGTNAIDLGNGKNRKGLCAGIERAGYSR